MSEERFNSKEIAVGDKVIVITSDWGSRAERVGKVVKKTPTGLIDVEYNDNAYPARFRENGTTYGKSAPYSRSSTWLENYTEEREAEIERRRKKRALTNWLKSFDYSKLTMEELEKVYICVSSCKNA